MSNGGIRIGTVSSVDTKTGMVSVVYIDRDNEVTDFLPYATFNDEYKPPCPGTKVIVLHLSNGGETGIVFGSYWNQNNAAENPGEYHKDLGKGACLDYNDGTFSIIAEHIRFVASDDNKDFTVAQLMEDIKKIKSVLGIT